MPHHHPSPVAVVFAAAGRGERMGGPVRKPWLELDGKPILLHTLQRFRSLPMITQRILAVHADDIPDLRTRWGTQLSAEYGVTDIVAGGATRTDTIWNALSAIRPAPDQVILIHDGVRPFIQQSVILAVIDAVRRVGAAIAAVPAVATVKQVDETDRIVATVDRSVLRLAQTPQGFRREIIMAAYEAARRDGVGATDDAAIVERTGQAVQVVTDRADNIKITTPEDLVLARAIMAWQKESQT